MLPVNNGDRFLVEQRDWKTGQNLGLAGCVAAIYPKTRSFKEHVVLTELNTEGKPGQSIYIFAPEYKNGCIPIVRLRGQGSPIIESLAKLPHIQNPLL